MSKRSKGAVATTGHQGALGVPPLHWRQHLQALITCLICLAILATKNALVTRRGCGHSIGVLHLGGTHLGWLYGAPLEPQIVTNPHFPLLEWSTGKGYLGW